MVFFFVESGIAVNVESRVAIINYASGSDMLILLRQIFHITLFYIADDDDKKKAAPASKSLGGECLLYIYVSVSCCCSSSRY